MSSPLKTPSLTLASFSLRRILSRSQVEHKTIKRTDAKWLTVRVKNLWIKRYRGKLKQFKIEKHFPQNICIATDIQNDCIKCTLKLTIYGMPD